MKDNELGGLQLYLLSTESIVLFDSLNEDSDKRLQELIQYSKDYKEYLEDKYERNNRISNWKRICTSLSRLFNR